MMTCAVCFGKPRGHAAEATEPHPAGRVGLVCKRCARDLEEAMEAHWEHLAARMEADGE